MREVGGGQWGEVCWRGSSGESVAGGQWGVGAHLACSSSQQQVPCNLQRKCLGRHICGLQERRRCGACIGAQPAGLGCLGPAVR